jgi:hypothetical protein
MLRDHPTIRRLLLAVAGTAAGVGVMLAQTPRREFEVASIRPNNAGRPTTYINPFVFAPGGHFTATNVTLVDVIVQAYQTSTHPNAGRAGLD